MPARRLSDLPPASRVFLDANIMIYGLIGASRDCRKLLDRCSLQELTGISLFETVNEATHKLMLGEAYARGYIRSEKAALLRRHFDAVSGLQTYWRDTERLLGLNLLFLPLDERILRAAHRERQAAGLLTNDSMIVACMRRYGIEALATSDRDFERVGGISVYRPADL
jgi:predicted nucleic acid-binding protein